jgi:ankyrin repeat protein
MPKKNQKSDQRESAVDFDDMLADFRAADLVCAPPTQRAANDIPANHARAQVPEETFPEATVLAAIRAGDMIRLKRLHRLGLVISVQHLFLAAASGNIALMWWMVGELGNDVDKASDDGMTPLLVACVNGQVDMVRYLVKTLSADINKANHEGSFPLHAAAMTEQLDVVRCLLKEFGVDVNQALHKGTTAMIEAARNGCLAVVQYLGRAHFAHINIVSRDGSTALIVAASNGHLDVVQCLVTELGAAVNLAGHGGRTALMMASYIKHEKVIRWLTRHGANVQASSIAGTAADASKVARAPIAQTQYLEAKAHCSNPGCSGAGLKKCTGCKQARYCGQTCQLAHWKTHKANCKASTST